MPVEAHVRISLATGELDVEGSEQFVGQFDDVIQVLLKRLSEGELAPAAANSGGASMPPAANEKTVRAGWADKRDFGELVQALPRSASGTDQILLAGWYAARSNSEAAFTTGDANKLLMDQGIKLSNASQALKNNLAAKRVFKVTGGRFKVSRAGEDYLLSLLGKAQGGGGE